VRKSRREEVAEQETRSPRIHSKANQGINQLNISSFLGFYVSRSPTYCL
jgi:hypothetical protein